jgi:regulator of nucleoside diphosphate kinase
MLGDPPEIRLTARDLRRLDALLAGLSNTSRVSDFLRRELDRALLVDDSEAGAFVKLGSAVMFKDEAGKVYSGILAFPGQIPNRTDVISILTPVGIAILGLSEGQSISYETPDRRIKTLTVLKIPAEPA